MLWYKSIKHDRIFQAIKESVKRLVEEDYDLDEAWKYAASKWKYLFEGLLKQYLPPTVEEEDENSGMEDDAWNKIAWIRKFCGLRSMMYATFHQDDSADVEKKNPKGIAKATIEKELCFDLYKKTLFDQTEMLSSMDLIRSHSHDILCEKVRKKTFEFLWWQTVASIGRHILISMRQLLYI